MQQAAQAGDFSLDNVPVVGDSLRDIEAAQTAGATGILVTTGKGERTLAQHGPMAEVPVFKNLREVADAILLSL